MDGSDRALTILLTSRKLLQRKLLDVESDLRGTLRNFGLKVGIVSRSRLRGADQRVRESFPRLVAIVGPLLAVRRVMRQQLAVLHKMLLDTLRGDPVCRRLMTAPGVGAVIAADLPVRRSTSRNDPGRSARMSA